MRTPTTTIRVPVALADYLGTLSRQRGRAVWELISEQFGHDVGRIRLSSQFHQRGESDGEKV